MTCPDGSYIIQGLTSKMSRNRTSIYHIDPIGFWRSGANEKVRLTPNLIVGLV